MALVHHICYKKALSNESQHVMNGVGNSTPLASEVSSLEDSAFKGTTKLSAEERKERIHRYMKKRSERNFSKKIKVQIFPLLSHTNIQSKECNFKRQL